MERTRKLSGDGYFPDPSLPLHVIQPAHPRSFIAHSHEFVELVLVTRGHGIHHVRGADASELASGITLGDAFLLRPGDVHAFSSCERLRLYDVIFMPSVLDGLKAEMESFPELDRLFRDGARKAFHLSLPQRLKAEDAIKRLDAELGARLPGYKLSAKAALLELLVSLCRAKPANGKPVPVDRVEELNKQHVVNKAIAFFEASGEGETGVEALAEKLGLSASHFSRVFKEACGLPPCDYMIRMRLEKAKALLLSTELSVARVAFRCGFCDASYMAKLFKRLEGCAPLEFRRKARGFE